MRGTRRLMFERRQRRQRWLRRQVSQVMGRPILNGSS